MTEQEDHGFEYGGTFYPWAATAFGGKDMILIDRITGMPLDEFQEVMNDETSSMRGATLLALMAVAVGAKYPKWTPERIYRMMLDLDLESVTFIGGQDGEETGPPAEGGTTQPPNSDSSSAASSSSPTPPESASSVTSAVSLR